jgi:hypothetical protein
MGESRLFGGACLGLFGLGGNCWMGIRDGRNRHTCTSETSAQIISVYPDTIDYIRVFFHPIEREIEGWYAWWSSVSA